MCFESGHQKENKEDHEEDEEEESCRSGDAEAPRDTEEVDDFFCVILFSIKLAECF